MNSKSYKVAVIGCGRIAGHHCRSIASVEGMEMAAVCDLIEEKCKAYSMEFDVPYFVNYHEMMKTLPEIDIVAVITPSGMHFEHGMEIMEKYAKHIIMEKPTFMRPSQLVKAYNTAEDLGINIFPVFQNRYNKAVQRVKKAIRDGEIGDIRIMGVRVRWCRPQRYYDLAPWRGTFSHDGGVLTNQGIHHVDLLRYLGGEVKRVNATMRTLGADIEVEDTVVATFAYDGDAVGTLEVTTAARPDDFEASLSIVGSSGLAQIGGIAVNQLQIFTPDPALCERCSEDFSGSVYGFGHEAMYRDILAFFRKGILYPVSREDCLGTIRLLHAFYRSDEAGGWVPVASDQESTRLGRPDDALANLYRTPLLTGEKA
ncbi:MAG: Gfo/Idh/MocA family oxidoreductase [Desulfobacterales bacterium]|nr:Gfo/Idh/MocA family oxidoreductase [Desulfobacterales bacterium]MCG2830376.1 Gfo/Idh/MocA family oxidoreductase [Desulfobacteraceae bacterium]